MTQVAPFIGIDFGTSKCSMAWYDNRFNRVDPILNDRGKPLTPSVVYLGPSKDQILVGEAAEQKLKQTNAEQRRFIPSVKRDLMRAWTKVLDGKPYTPVKVASIILEKLREDAKKYKFHEPVERVVITHPTSFDIQQKGKIVEAATLAGFTKIELLPEPVAAALAYASLGLKVGNYVMVYDFGGGTFDVAVLERISGNKFKPAISRGDAVCGGDDLDRAVYIYCEEIVHREWQGQKISLNEEYDLRFLRKCRECKENLTSQSDYTFSDYLPSNGKLFEHTLTRSTFERGIKTYIDKTVSLTQEVLQEARSKNCHVNTIVLVGGSSRVPLVLRSLTTGLSAFSVKPEAWDYQDVAVAMGAAYHAQHLWGTKEQGDTLSGDDFRLTGPLGGVNPLPSPTEEYRHAVKEAWATRSLTTEKVNKLKAEATRLHLDSTVAASIEREIMGNTKENILATKLHDDAKAAYRQSVKNIQVSQLTQQQVDALAAKARSSGLSDSEAAAIEREVWFMTREEKLRSLQPPTRKASSSTPSSSSSTLNTPVKQPTGSGSSSQVLSQSGTQATSKPKKVWKFTFSKFLALCWIAGSIALIAQASNSATTSSSSSPTVIGSIAIIVGLIWFFHKNRSV